MYEEIQHEKKNCEIASLYYTYSLNKITAADGTFVVLVPFGVFVF